MKEPEWLRRIGAGPHRAERLISRAERGEEDALFWCGFWNMTLITVVVLAVVLLVKWWLS